LRERRWLAAWPAIFAAPAMIAAWQLWERWTGGVFPIEVLLGYMRTFSLQSSANKFTSALALTAHAGWIVFPALIALAFTRKAGLWRWLLIVIAALLLFSFDPNPLFWASAAMGLLLLLSCLRREFLSAWIVIFFAASLAIFFAGSARYLLPIAAPVAIVIARDLSLPSLYIGFAAQMVISLGLAAANYQHWDAVRDFSNQVLAQANGRRIWINGEWGMRHYLEARGAQPLLRDTKLSPGDLIVTSQLGQAVTVTAPVAPLMDTEITPSIPLRIISIEGGSGYSASSKGVLPFEISREVVDRMRLDIVAERNPELSYLDPKDPRAAAQLIEGLYGDGWASGDASVVLKVPEHSTQLEVSFFIPDNSPARTITLLAENIVLGETTFPQPGAHTFAVPFHTSAPQAAIGLRVDKTFQSPPDTRRLGIIVTGIGFK
jgi:hypothetical protein